MVKKKKVKNGDGRKINEKKSNDVIFGKGPIDKADIKGEAFTWDDIVAMSDSEDEISNFDAAVDGDERAKKLRQVITSSMGDILSSVQNQMKTSDNNDGSGDDEFEEDVLDESSENDGEDECVDEHLYDAEESGEDEIEVTDNTRSDGGAESNSFIDRIKKKTNGYGIADDGSDDEDDAKSDNESDDQEDQNHPITSKGSNLKALVAITAELEYNFSKLHWQETFVVVSNTPLPFGKEHGDPETNPLDIHDDLKREVAFYNNALETAELAKQKCEQCSVPFSRPDDFFAEMVKTDDHMARIKDRLIFENKKIEAVAQRRSNKEQKLRAKESQANRLAEKAKRKKEHFQEVNEWANSVANNRGGALREGIDDYFLNNRNNKAAGPNKKRQAADRKFGYGGKRGRFKQNDRKSMNDMSGYNPRGNFAGGMKKTAKNGSGANRSGKRARDAKRARR